MRRGVIAATTRLLVLLGHPVDHSVSPAMHNAAIAAAGLDLAYVAADVAPGDVPAAIAGLGALGAVGANVTLPHKRAAMATCATVSDDARAVGAVNTLTFAGGDAGPVGDNTDVSGFLAGLGERAVTHAVVLGAGGAARAVVVALARRDVAVTLVVRHPDRATDVAALGVGRPADVVAVDTPEVAACVAAAGLVVNATPLGWHGERLPAPFHDLQPGQVAHDLNYAEERSPFLVDADRAGADTIDGLAMVVGQAAASFRTWTGVDPDVAAMATAARAARIGA